MKTAKANRRTTWHIYLIECADGTLYTGITIDLERRLTQHNAGKGARYTRSRLPVMLKATLPVGTKSQALRAEMAIKRLPREKKIEAALSPAFIKIARRRKAKPAGA